MTREEWLLAFVEQVRPDFDRLGVPIPDQIRITCGWPSKGARGKKNRSIGECWPETCSADKHHEMFISPCITDLHEVGGVIIHELVHAAVGTKHGHKAAFRRPAVALGLQGKMTATEPGEDLCNRISEIRDVIGCDYPHAKLDLNAMAANKQGTRQLKVQCPACGYIVRTTQKWIDVGLPTCFCGEEMVHESA